MKSIAPIVIKFWENRLAGEYVLTGRDLFYADELRKYVRRRGKVAPGSADRVLRDLRSKGKLNYQVLDRSSSWYQALPL